MKALAKFLSGLMVATVIAAVVVAAFELALRFVPAGQGYYIADEPAAAGSEFRTIRLPLFPPNARYLFRPPSEYIAARTDGLEAREYVTETDADGFIKPGRIHDEPELTIAFLGGSTTENFLVPAAARFPHLTGREIEACTGARVNTINAGRSGITAMHSLNIFLNTVLPLQPDIVVMMHNINDYAMLHHEGSYWNDHPDRSLLTTAQTGAQDAPGRMTRLANLLIPRTANFVRHRIGGAASPVTDAAPDAQEAPRWSTVKPIEIDRVRTAFGRALETFVHAARAWDVQPALMTMPARWPESLADAPDSFHMLIRDKLFAIDDYPAFTAGFDAMNDTIRETAARLDAPLIDLAKAIPPSPELMFDAIHFNEAGSRMAAGVIGQALCKAGLR